MHKESIMVGEKWKIQMCVHESVSMCCVFGMCVLIRVSMCEKERERMCIHTSDQINIMMIKDRNLRAWRRLNNIFLI